MHTRIHNMKVVIGIASQDAVAVGAALAAPLAAAVLG